MSKLDKSTISNTFVPPENDIHRKGIFPRIGEWKGKDNVIRGWREKFSLHIWRHGNHWTVMNDPAQRYTPDASRWGLGIGNRVRREGLWYINYDVAQQKYTFNGYWEREETRGGRNMMQHNGNKLNASWWGHQVREIDNRNKKKHSRYLWQGLRVDFRGWETRF